MKNRFFLLLLGTLINFSVFAQNADQVEKYQKDAEDLISFLEYIFNALGNEELSVADKDVIVNESYLKAFSDDKVQIEDDLITGREVAINKDVQAYLKDIDFFFKSAHFELRIEEMKQGINENGDLFFTVKINRNLQAIELNGDSLNNSLTRFVELNVNPAQKQLKIASIYTTKLGEKEELIRWWISLSPSWKNILGKDLYVSDAYQLNDISIVNDSTYYIGGQKADPKVYKVFEAIKKATGITELDLSGNKEILGVEPLYELTNLQSLNVSSTGISSLFPIRNLTTIEQLDCSNTIIDDITPLRYSHNLSELNISSTNVLDIGVIEGFSKLRKLEAANLQLDSLQSISRCGSLQELNLEKNKKVADVAFLAGLSQLKQLNLNGTSIADVSMISKLDNLELLDVSNTKITDISSLSTLKQLKILSIENTGITKLDGVGDAPLTRVNCDGSKIAKSDLLTFMQKQPKAVVIFQTAQLKKWWNELDEVWKELVFDHKELKDDPETELLHQIVRVDSINISGQRSITNLNPLSQVLFLKKINLSNTGISDLTPLKDQAYLELIDITNTNVSDISALRGKNYLVKLISRSNKVEDISPLADLKSLSYMDFDSSMVKDVSVINSLPAFKIGYFDHTQVTDEEVVELDYDGEHATLIYKSDRLTSWWGHLDDEWQDIFRDALNFEKTPSREELHKLTGLKKFIVKSILIKEISVMQEFTRLRELTFNDTQITDISPLGKMTKLEVLDCSRNPIEEISPLAQMSGLRVFYADNTQISDIDALQNLKNLEELKISNTNVKDLRSIEGLTELKVLDFSNTRVKNIKPVMELMNLKSLRCFNNSINEKRIDEFKASHPNCEVVFY